MKKPSTKEFLKMMGRMQEEDYVTSDEFYKMFNAVIEAVKASKVDNSEAIKGINKQADKSAKELENHFRSLLKAVDKRMRKVQDGKAGKDGSTPIAGLDYPEYKEIRSFITEAVDKLPKPQDVREVITIDYIKQGLESLEGHDRLSFEAIDGLKDEIETQFRLLDAATNKSPKYIAGGVVGTGSGSGVTTLSGLTDVTLTSAAQGNVLYHNGTAWVNLATGADGTFLKSNGAAANPSWATPAGSGDVSKVGTPVDAQIGVWTGDGTIEGDAALTFDTTTDTLAIGASGKLNFGAVNILSDAAGTTTLANIDAVDATTDATLTALVDTAAVTAAGALMDSELTAIADVKALDQSVVSGASPTFATTNMTEGTDKNFVTDAEAVVIGNTSGANTGDEAAADLTTAGVIEIATGAETNTGTDATRAVSPDGLDDWTGSAQITTVGTLSAGDVDAAVTDASTTAKGKVELATDVETATGTATDRAVTPFGAASVYLANVADDASPSLGGALNAEGNDINNGGVLFLTEQADAEADVAGKGQIWVNTATPNELWFTDDAGTDRELGKHRFMVQLLADDADQATDTTIGGDFRISNRAIKVIDVGAYVDTAGVTGTSTIDINEAGTTILSTKITIDTTEKSSETAATAPVISDSAIAADAIVTFDLDAIHSGTAAKGLKVWIDYVYA